MVDNFDNLVFFSSITIFIAALIIVFLYEFFSSKKNLEKIDHLKVPENMNKKSTVKKKRNKQTDQVG